jgi:hypothetical protein
VETEEAVTEGADWEAEVDSGTGVDSAAVATQEFRIQGSVCGLEFSVQGLGFRV